MNTDVNVGTSTMDDASANLENSSGGPTSRRAASTPDTAAKRGQLNGLNI